MLSRLQLIRNYTINAVDNPGKLSTLIVKVHAGSRYSPKDGLSHLLSRFNFQNTNAKSSLRLVRESELLGGQVDSKVCNEYITLKATFLKEQLPYFVETLGNVLYKTSFRPHELTESVIPAAKHDLHEASKDPFWRANNLLYQVTYRNDGLGKPVLYDGVENVTLEDIKDFANKVYTRDNIEIHGIGVNGNDLNRFVTDSLINSLPAGKPLKSTLEPKSFIGEARLRSTGESVAAISVPLYKTNIATYQILTAYLNSALFPYNIKAELATFNNNAYGLFKLFVKNEDPKVVTKEIKEIVSKLKKGLDISEAVALAKSQSFSVPLAKDLDKVESFKLGDFSFVTLGDVSNLPFKDDL